MIRAAAIFVAALAATPLGAAEESYSFDAAQFEKKPVELGGYVELKADHFRLNPGAVFYELNALGRTRRETLDRITGTLKLSGKARAGDWVFAARTHSEHERDQWSEQTVHRFDELVGTWKPTPGFALDVGKTVLKWGKGYAWNPTGFVERPKDPNDPELAREGFTMLAADMVKTFDGPLQSIALTPVIMPVSRDVNADFGRPDHLNLAARLYLLYRDTDIDFYLLGSGSRSRRVGMDFSRNLGTNLEVHGEVAYIAAQDFQTADAGGTFFRRTEAARSWLLGMRYLTEQETTYIAELYRNGTGYSETEFRSFVDIASRALLAAPTSPLLQRVRSISSAYARQTPMRNYLYVRAVQKEPFDMLYFNPALTAIVNLADRSYSIAPELLYTGIKNVELRARLIALGGRAGTEFGERQNTGRVELYARWYF